MPQTHNSTVLEVLHLEQYPTNERSKKFSVSKYTDNGTGRLGVSSPRPNFLHISYGLVGKKVWTFSLGKLLEHFSLITVGVRVCNSVKFETDQNLPPVL